MQNYIGKEEINLKKQFFSHQWVEEIIDFDELQEGEQEEIQKIGVFKVNSDSVAELPLGGVSLAFSTRT